MPDTTRNRAAEMLRSHDRYVRFILILASAAAIVAVGVAMVLRQRGMAKVHEITVLECHYTGEGAHTHNSDCYDADGNLVCPLPERALHTHDDSCYTETSTLVCGLEESEEHAHTDECYEVTRELTCGQEEVTEEHVHGPACFVTIKVTEDEDPEAAIEAALEPQAEPLALEQILTQNLVRTDESGSEYVFLSASVKAPAGTLPTDAALRVSEVSADASQAATSQVEALIARDLGANAAIGQMALAELALTDASGNETAPTGTVEVKLSASVVREADELLLVQLPDEARGTTEASIVDGVSLVNWDDTDTSVGNEDTLMFWTSEQLSSYAIVEVDTSAATEPAATAATAAITADAADAADQSQSGLIEITLGEQPTTTGTTATAQSDAAAMPAQSFEATADNVRVEVTAPEGAFPAGTTMTASAVSVADVAGVVASAAPGIYDQIAAVDIKFFDASGKEIEPLVPISVTMTNINGKGTDGQPVVMHMEEDGGASVVNQSAIPTSSDEVVFEADTF